MKSRTATFNPPARERDGIAVLLQKGGWQKIFFAKRENIANFATKRVGESAPKEQKWWNGRHEALKLLWP